jgi:regulator of nucleoside diphosphate kinase
MLHRDTLLTHNDHRRLRSLLNQGLSSDGGTTTHLAALRQRVRRARVVNPKEMPRNVVTMNSQVLLRNLDSGARFTCTLAYPGEARTSHHHVSVARPLGTAMLGKRVGQIIRRPSGTRDQRLRIQTVLYQPEAAGDMHL